MNLRNLKYFCAAYEAGSTVAAAKLCHVTQPAISNAIAQLEQELGAQLFTRQSRRLEPTAAGSRLFRLGGKLLADAQAIAESFQDASSHPRLTLHIHAAISIEQVQAWLRHVRRELPLLAVTVVGPGVPADLELIAQACAAPSKTFLPLWDERYVLVVPPEHPFAVQEQVTLRDLHGAAYVERTHCELSSHWHVALGEFQILPEVRAQAASEEWAMGLVAAGVGVTIAPLHAATRRHDVVVRADVPELAGVVRQVGLAYEPAMAQRGGGAVAEVLRICEAWSDAMAWAA